jgi:hypothetical protein
MYRNVPKIYRELGEMPAINFGRRKSCELRSWRVPYFNRTETFGRRWSCAALVLVM